MLSRLQSFGPTILWILSILLFLRGLLAKITDPDLWWHMAAGREILAQKQFLEIDIFSHTLLGAPWMNFEWIPQLLFTVIGQSLGAAGLIALKVFLGFLILGVLVWLLALSHAKGSWLLLFLWTGFLMLRPRFMVRPELFTLFFFCTLLILVLQTKGDFEFWGKKFPWIMFGIFVVWANCHGGFIFGLAALFWFGVGAFWADADKKFQKVLWISLGLGILGSFLNPYGPKLYWVFWEVSRQVRLASDLIAEWAPTSVQSSPLFWGVFMAAAVSVVHDLLTKRREAYFFIPIVVVFAVGGSLFVRNTALFAFVGLPYVAEKVFSSALFQDASSRKKWILIGWGLCLLPVMIHARSLSELLPSSAVAQTRFPLKAVEFFKENKIQGALFNTYEFGGYLQWTMGPAQKIFMDGRYLFHGMLYDQRQLSDALLKKWDTGPWQAYLDKHQVEAAIVGYPKYWLAPEENAPPFTMTLINAKFPPHRWALIYFDESAMIFVKRTKTFTSLIDRYAYDVLTPYNLAQLRWVVKQDPLLAEKAYSEWERHHEEMGWTFRGHQIKQLLEVLG